MFGTNPLATSSAVVGARDGKNDPKNKGLWEIAFDDLSHTDRRTLAEYEAYLLGPNLSILDDLRTKIQQEEEAYAQKEVRLKIKGREVALSEVCQNILNHLDQFLIIGDIIIQYDPGHVAIPWGIVRGLVKLGQNASNSVGVVVEGLERVSAVITRFASIEAELARKNYAASSDLMNAMAQLYTAMLSYMATAKRFYETRSLARAVAGMINKVQADMDSAWKRITDKEESAWKLRVLLRDQQVEEQLELLQIQAQNPRPSRQNILKWIDAVYTDDSYELALETRLQGTCRWIFRNPSFQHWLTPDPAAAKLLWIRAGPGYGKTILCASIVEYIQCLPERHTAPLVPFFFCSSDDIFTRDPAAIVRSWVAQLVSQNNEAMDIAVGLSASATPQATRRGIWSLYGNICARLPNCVFVVDGLDECNDYNKAHVEAKQAFLKSLCETIPPTVRVLIVSREDSQLRDFVTNSVPNGIHISEYTVTPENTEDDIRSFTHDIVSEKLQGIQNQVLIDKIVQSIIDKSDGMFLWIRLISKDISRGKPPKLLARIVEDMPHGLVAIFQREIDAILSLTSYERARAIDVLRWIAFASRPLRVEEICEALIIDPDSSDEYPFDELPESCDENYTNDQIRRLCRSLVEVRSQCFGDQVIYRTVHFVHSSLRDFLTQSVHGIPKHVDLSAEHSRIARACLHYLLYKEVSDDYSFSQETFKDKLQAFPFLPYAATQWSHHASRSNGSKDELLPLVKRIFAPWTTPFALFADAFEFLIDGFESMLPKDTTQLQRIGIVSKSLDMYNGPVGRGAKLHRRMCRSGVYLAARLGFPDLKCPHTYEELGGAPLSEYTYALQLAIARKQKHAIKRLLDVGTPASHQLPFGFAPILIAANLDVGSDSEYIVDLLISAGADVNFANEHGITSLYSSASKGNLSVVRTLLSNGATIRADHRHQRTPLHLAAAGGYDEILELLLEKGADFNARDVNSLTAVSLAMMLGHEHTVRLLIDKGADTTIKKDGVSLLHMTAGHGLGEIANLLITRGAAIDDLADDELATLHYAARGGDLAVAEVLIKRGADINIRGQGLVTPLHLATESGEAEMVQLLVRHGADPNFPDSDGLTAFHHSVACGYMEIAIFLLGSGGANPSLRDLFGRTALHLAVQQKQDHMVQFLIDGGSQADARDDTNMAPLHLAAVVGNTASAQTLLENGADITAGTSYSAGRAQRAIITRVNALLAQPESAPLAASLRAVIHLAVQEVQLPDAVRLSLNRMAETIQFTPSISLGLSQSQRSMVSAFRREVFAILEAPDIFADDGWTPLHIAAFNGREDFVRILAHKGALIDALTVRGLSATQIAANQGHGKVVQLLEEPGWATYLRQDARERIACAKTVSGEEDMPLITEGP